MPLRLSAASGPVEWIKTRGWIQPILRYQAAITGLELSLWQVGTLTRLFETKASRRSPNLQVLAENERISAEDAFDGPARSRSRLPVNVFKQLVCDWFQHDEVS